MIWRFLTAKSDKERSKCERVQISTLNFVKIPVKDKRLPHTSPPPHIYIHSYNIQAAQNSEQSIEK